MTLIAVAAVLVLLPALAALPHRSPRLRTLLVEHARLQERWVARHDLSGREALQAVRGQAEPGAC